MEIVGLNKIVDALGNAFSVFDFSFFISGAVTLGFIALDLHYYGHDGILRLHGWIAALVYVIAIYVCGLMSWSIGKLMRWGVCRFVLGKGGIKKDFEDVFIRALNANKANVVDADSVFDTDYSMNYTRMWIEIEKEPKLASKYSSLNKMWVMVAVYEGLACSWVVGLFVYLDGCLVGNWITTDCFLYNLVPPVVLLVLFCASIHRAIVYSRDLVKEVVTTYYNK